MANLGGGILGRIIGGVVSIAVALGAYFIFFKGQEKVEQAKAPKVGECLVMTGSSFDADHKEVDCGDAEATYKIVSDKGSCDEAELNYTISLGNDRNSGNVADLCLDLNVAEGDCIDLGGMSTPAAKVACTEGATNTSILKVVSVGKAGDKCTNGSQPLENVTRKSLLCLGPAA